MDSTVVVAAMGFVATFATSVLVAWMTARLQRRGSRDGRILDAKVLAYGDCATTLYEYERATFHRVKARLEGWPEELRVELRDEAYRSNAKARSAIGRVRILSRVESLREGLESVREAVGELNKVESLGELTRRHENLSEELGRVLAEAHSDLIR